MLDVMEEIEKIEPKLYNKQKFYLKMSRTLILQNGLKDDVIDKMSDLKSEFSDIYKRETNLFNQVARDLLIFSLAFVNALGEDWEDEIRRSIARVKQVKDRIRELKEGGKW